MAIWPRKVQEAHQTAVAGQFFIPATTSVDIAGSIRPQGWQTEAWRLWHMVGELRSPTTYIAKVTSRRIDYLQTTNGTQADAETSATAIQAALGDLPLEEAIRLMALNLQVAGEFWLIEEEDTWAIYSITTDKLTEKVDAAKAAGRAFKRVYDSDPSDQNRAESAFSTAIDPATELLTLGALSSAQNRSRIAQAGILMVPADAKFQGDPFGAGLEQAMMASIKDVSSPTAMVPIKVEMDSALIDKVKHLNFERPFDEKLAAKIDKATHRIALALDIPPELLLGMGEMNHWNAWATREDTYNAVIGPLAEKIAGVLEYIVMVTSGEAVTIDPDPAELLVRNPTPRDVLDAAKIGAVSLDTVRSVLDLNDTDAPSVEDLETIRSMLSPGSAAEDDTSYGAPQIENSGQENA